MARKSKSKKSSSLTYATGVAVEPDYVRLAAYLDAIDPYEVDETRMCSYDNSDGGDDWMYVDLPMHIVSMCVWTGSSLAERLYINLSREGEVVIVGPGGNPYLSEHIPDAGLNGVWSGDYGYVSDIAAIGEGLYVCGDSRQVYRRDQQGDWQHIDTGILLPPRALDSTPADSRILMAIDGLREDSIYTAGTDGELFHFNGASWTQIPTSTDEQLLTIKVLSESEVYVAGSNGTLLKGSVGAGFRDISSIDDNMRISSVEKYSDRIYAASNLGLFVYDDVGKRLEPVKTGLVPELADSNVVQAVGGTLWAIGYKDLAFYDGKQWTRVDHPDNDPIR
jgi:hypothetical protein